MKNKRNSTIAIFLLTTLICLSSHVVYSQINLIQDGGFEAGAGSGNWVESSSNFGSPICDLAGCGNGTGTGPHSGTYFTWFGGLPSGVEIGSLEQTIMIPVDTVATLSFYLEMISCDSPQDFLEVKIDGNTVFFVDGGSPLCGNLGYSMQIIDVSNFADGNLHTLTFFSTTYSVNQNVTNFFVDDIVLFTDSYNFIKGRLFADLNSNSIQDNGEPGLSHIRVEESVTGNAIYTNNDGDYILTLFQLGSFSVAPDPVNLFNSSPSSIPVVFSSFGNIDSSNNFSYQAGASFNELRVALIPATLFRSGFNAAYHVQYSNEGTTIQNPLITFYPDADIDYVSSTVTPSLITSDSIQWNPGSLSPFQPAQFTVHVHVDQGLPIGTLVSSTAKIEPIVADTNPVNNIHTWETYTINSYDPNDIQVNRNTMLSTEFPNPPDLYYTIRFQNTGNDTAFTVRITNEIPLTLDPTSLEFVGSSHDVSISYNSQMHKMEYLFNNILLPDSNINETESHGYISYRIKPVNNLVVGDSILSNADIYFDFNTPVHTNDALTIIIDPVGLAESNVPRNHVKIYPNPAMNAITVDLTKLKGNEISLDLCDMFGRKIKSLFEGTITDDNQKLEYDVTDISSGVYFILARSSEYSENLKFIKY